MTSRENGPIKMIHFPCDVFIWIDKTVKKQPTICYLKIKYSTWLFKIAPWKTLHSKDFEHRLIFVNILQSACIYSFCFNSLYKVFCEDKSYRQSGSKKQVKATHSALIRRWMKSSPPTSLMPVCIKMLSKHQYRKPNSETCNCSILLICLAVVAYL